jgi:hypothetical protein
MNRKEREYWEATRQQAQSRIPSVYSATFFSRRNISIVDQQSRCFNLSWSLVRLKRIRAEHHVAIVGGGISGMTCAVALAAWSDCLVTVFERDSVQLRRFRRAGHRYIHPDLNHTGGEDGRLDYYPNKATAFPFMNWSGDYAPAFAEEFIAKFDHYRSTLNIVFHLDTEVGAPSPARNRVDLRVKTGTVEKKMHFDAVILATGFGEERLGSEARTNDISYWLSGNPLSYRASPLRKRGRERVLVSGNGDSAVIELAHLLIQRFDHENIFSFLPSNSLAPRLSKEYAASVANLSHRRIESEHRSLPGWFDSMREIRQTNPGVRLHRARGFDLQRDLYATGEAARGSATFDKALRDRFEELASLEIKTCLDGFRLHKIFRPSVRGVFRQDIDVVVTGRSPTIYSVAQAPLNWFLLRLLEHYGALSYHQTELVGARLVRNLVQCSFKDRSLNGAFHRVITRHGPDYAGFSSDPSLRSEDPDPREDVPLPEYFWVPDKKKLIGARLRGAQGRTLPLADFPYHVFDSRAAMRDADNVLWTCHGLPQERRANKLFRRLKRSRTLIERAGLCSQLLKLALEVHQGHG